MDEYAVCLLSVVPVRSDSNDPSEIVTQLLFGNCVKIIELASSGSWCKVEICRDGYIGWVDPKQLQRISTFVYSAYEALPYRFALGNNNIALFGDQEMTVLQGSELRLDSPLGCSLEGLNFIYKGSQRGIGDLSLIQLATSYLGAPYLWGGKIPFGIDCSGFVQQIFLMMGKELPRDASQQVDVGDVVCFDDRQEGDLAYFVNDNGNVIHVGLCLNENEIIHSHGQIRIDTLDDKGILNTATQVYSHKLSVVKRVLLK